MVTPNNTVKIREQQFVCRNEGNLRTDYKIGKVLGKGAYGEVRVAVHRASAAQRAVKTLKKKHMSKKEIEVLMNEITVLKELDHPNIVKIFEYFEDKQNFYIVTEICRGGELFDEIIERGHFQEKDAAVVTRCLLSSVNYCH